MTTIFGSKKGASAIVDNRVDPVLVDPVGGLELNSSNELKIKRDGGIHTTTDGTSVLVDPVGGLELNSSNKLKIKCDGGIQTTADGTSVIDRVKKGGDTMTGDLLLLNDASGPDTVRHLGCLDLGEGKAFSIMVGNIENQLQLANIAPGQTQTRLTAETTHGFAVNVVSTREFEVGEGFTKVSSNLNMSEKTITLVDDPTEDQDAATKNTSIVASP